MSPTEIVDHLRKHLAGERDVVAAYLFGSVARGSSSFRDVDVAILLEKPRAPTFDGLCLGLAADLESLLRVPVDLVVLNGAPPDLIHRVLRDGVLVLDRDPAARIRFEVRARNEYFDMAPIRRHYRRMGGGRA